MLRRKPLEVLYVGTLPPHPGGTAIVGAQLLVGLARSVHSVRALAPITAESLRSGDQFAASHPEIGVARVEVSFFDVSADVVASEQDRRSEGDQIEERLSGLVAENRPDVVIIGRERALAWHVPDLARARSIPSILVFHGSMVSGILSTLDQAMAERLVDQLRKVDLIVPIAAHLAEPLQQWGLRNFVVIPNGVDLRRFRPRRKEAALLRRLDLRDDQTIVVHASNLKNVKRPP